MQFIISNIDYVVIDCGYTHRLIKYVEDIQKEATYWDAKLLQLNENIYSTDDFDVKKMVNHLVDDYRNLRKPAVFKCDSIITAFKLCEQMMEYKHCGFFCFGSLYKLCQYNYEGKQVLIMEFDSESG